MGGAAQRVQAAVRGAGEEPLREGERRSGGEGGVRPRGRRGGGGSSRPDGRGEGCEENGGAVPGTWGGSARCRPRGPVLPEPRPLGGQRRGLAPPPAFSSPPKMAPLPGSAARDPRAPLGPALPCGDG